jgi:hypothetical protein
MFWTYCSYACRAIILLSVIFLVGYVLLENNKSVEKFDNATQEQLDKYEVIRSVFQSSLFRDPTNDEYKQYSKVMQNAGDTSNLITALKASPDYKNRVIESDNIMLDGIENAKYMSALKTVDPNLKLKTQKQVIDAYNKALDRMPQSKELTFYTYKLLNDKTFTAEKLEKLLKGSQEYQRMTQNQSNLVNASLSANITTRQLHLEVKRIFESVVPDTALSKEYEDFLVGKYIEYNLDETRLSKLIRLLQTVDANKEVCPAIVVNKPVVTSENSMPSKTQPVSTVQPPPKTAQSATAQSTTAQSTTAQSATAQSTTAQSTTAQSATSKSTTAQSTTSQSAASKSTTAQGPSAQNAPLPLPSAHCSLDPYMSDDYMDPFTKAMLTNRCIYFQDQAAKNAQSAYRGQNALAEAISQRNVDLCSVSGYDTYNNYTSIEDAKSKTFVGSYVSPFGKR